jgi:hypothetical protein
VRATAGIDDGVLPARRIGTVQPSAVDGLPGSGHDLPMTDELDPREAERARRRDRDLSAEQRDLMRPGMGKVFKQIQDAQREAAKASPKPRRGRPAPRG